MKVCIVGWPADPDADILRSCNDNNIETEWLMLGPENPYNRNYMGSRYDIPTPERIEEVLAMKDIDLFLYKYPFWLEQYPRLAEIIDTRPVVAWQTELGPTTNPYGFQASERFQLVAANSRYEMKKYKEQFPDKKILYMPFGCVKWHADEFVENAQYASDLVADGSCHYACNDGKGCEGGWKHVSCDVMIAPVAEKYSFACYGHLPHLHDTKHGWEFTPWASYHRGTYECTDYVQVYSSCKLYLGITFNWQLGGFGVKLPRALSTGIPVLWHKTIGLEEEGLIEGSHYIACEDADATAEWVEFLLKHPNHREILGYQGRMFAEANYQYSDLLTDLVKQVNA